MFNKVPLNSRFGRICLLRYCEVVCRVGRVIRVKVRVQEMNYLATRAGDYIPRRITITQSVTVVRCESRDRVVWADAVLCVRCSAAAAELVSPGRDVIVFIHAL